MLTSSAKTIFENAVCVDLRLSKLRTRRTIATSSVEVEADPDLIHVSKDILDAEELKAVGHLHGEIRRYLWSRHLPSSLFRNGIYLIPLALVDEVDKKLQTYRTELTNRIKKFLAVYPERIEEAKKRLGKLFDEEEYPSGSRLSEAFEMKVSYITFQTPTSLKSVSSALFQRESKKLEESMAESAREIQQALREAMGSLVEHMVERLTGGDGGKPKKFKDTSIQKVQEFLDTFQARNITGDAQLGALVEKAKKLLVGISPDDLREDDKVRKIVAQGFEKLKGALDGMLQEKGTRKISREED